MKDLNQYIIEKLKIRKTDKKIYDIYSIIDLLESHKLTFIDRYDNELLINGLTVNDDHIIDRIEFDFKNEQITLFYYLSTDTNVESEYELSYEEWDDMFDEYITKSIYNYIEKNI